MPPCAIWSSVSVDRLKRIGQAVAEPARHRKLKNCALRKFRRAPDAAMRRIDELKQAPRKVRERRVAGNRVGTGVASIDFGASRSSARRRSAAPCPARRDRLRAISFSTCTKAGRP